MADGAEASVQGVRLSLGRVKWIECISAASAAAPVSAMPSAVAFYHNSHHFSGYYNRGREIFKLGTATSHSRTRGASGDHRPDPTRQTPMRALLLVYQRLSRVFNGYFVYYNQETATSWLCCR